VPLADLGTFVPGDICHDNVDQWLLAHPNPEDEWRNAPGEVKLRLIVASGHWPPH